MGLFNNRNRDARRADRKDRRANRRSDRAERRDQRRENRQDRREERQERREERVIARQDRREERREDRQERREARQEAKVTRDERALVIYSEFNEDNDPKMMKKLYSFVERQGLSMGITLLQGSYDRVIPVTGPAATCARFVDAIEEALFDDGIEEVDVILHSHGGYDESTGEGKIYFAPDPEGATSEERSGAVPAPMVGDMIEDLMAEDRLRMFYTTACWGDHIAEAMVNSGFSCGAGAVDVNTNSALEYPIFLTLWKTGLPFGTCIRQALKRSAYRKTDAAARLIKGDFWRSADSYKALHGDVTINKRSNADF